MKQKSQLAYLKSEEATTFKNHRSGTDVKLEIVSTLLINCLGVAGNFHLICNEVFRLTQVTTFWSDLHDAGQ